MTPAVNTLAGPLKLDDAAVAELEESFRGELVFPGDGTYDERAGSGTGRSIGSLR
jgi:hypothetical protein